MGDISTAKSLLNAGNIINIISAVLISLGLLVTIIGIIFIPVPIFLAWWTNKKTKNAIQLIDEGKYKEAKDEMLVPAIVDLVLMGIIPGLLLLLGALMLPESQNQTITTITPSPIEGEKSEQEESQSENPIEE